MTPARRTGLAISIALAVFLMIDAAAWFWVTGRLRAGWETWRAQAALQGLRIQSAPPVCGGWPFSANITLAGFAVDGGLFDWHADAVHLAVSPMHPTVLTVGVTGRQSVRLDGLPPIGVTARGLTAAIPFSDPDQIAFEGHSLTAALAGGTLEISVLAGRVDPTGLVIAASHLTVPAAGLPFGGAIDRFTARLHATVALFQPGAASRPPSAMADAWAKAGGQIIVDEASLVWGPLDAQGHFSAGLDSGLQPIAAGSLHMSGYPAAIDALVRAGTIGRNAARVATTLLDMMATSTDPATVDVPLSLKGGSLAMGAIPLLRIPSITWP